MQTISGSAIKRLQEKQQDFKIHACFTVEMFGGKRWYFTTCALFMLCPRRYYVAASRLNEWSHPNKVPVPKTIDEYGKSLAPRRFLSVLKDKGSSSRLEEAEPGFDFNEEEIKKLKLWPGGAIPYYIDEFSFDKVFRDRIRNFLDVTNGVTGLNFLELHRPPGDDETRWVFFVNRQGLLNCVDHPLKNFTSEGVQKVLLGYNCLSNSGELAEVVLALVGVPPQHNSPDRNSYIEIVKNNILPGKAYLFDILHDNEWLFHEVDYDFASASHYNLHKYTLNGKATIKPLNTIQEIAIGDRKGFSYTDIWKIRMLYNYITKKRLKSVSVPECNKLFNLGTNFSNYIHESEEEVQPRPKPHKYLGLPDEPQASSSYNNQTKNETIDSVPHTDKEATKEENSEINNSEEENVENDNQKPDESHEKINKKNASESEDESKISGTKHSLDIEDENTLTQSDSRNDDENKAKGLKFTRPGFIG